MALGNAVFEGERESPLHPLDEPTPEYPLPAVPLAMPATLSSNAVSPLVAMPVTVPTTSFATAPMAPPIAVQSPNHSVGRSYLARMHAQTAVHLLRLGGAILIAGFLVEVAVMLVISELRFTRRVTWFAVPAGLLQFVPAVVIFLAAEALNKKRHRGLVLVGSVLSLLFGGVGVMGAVVLAVYGLQYCPIFILALLAVGVSWIFITGGYRGMAAVSDPEFQAAFDRGRRPLP